MWDSLQSQKASHPSNFMVQDTKFHGIENPHHHVKNFISVTTLKEIDKDIFHITFPWTFEKDVMRWHNTIDR